MAKSQSDRIDRLEAALQQGLNIDLAEYDDKAVVASREAQINAAAAKAQKIIEKALEEAAKPLSNEERIARIERALASGASL
jgi:hypothetical protein